jgi:hypothetical protein
LPLVELAYNNNYQSTIKMVPFEFLYGRPCQTPLSWDRLEDGVLVGPEAIQELKEQIQMIRKGMEEVQDRQKGLSMCIASTIIMKGLMASCASFFEALHDVYLVSLCDFRSVILCMRLTDFLAGCWARVHGGANPLSGPSHSTATVSNC